MHFMVTWRLHPGKTPSTLELFSQLSPEQELALRGDVEVVTRWHDLVGGTGVMICKAESAAAIGAYGVKWNAHMDLTVTPVIDDDEVRAIGKAMASS